MKLRVLACASCCSLLGGVFGCASEGGSTPSEEAIDMAFIPKASNNVVFKMGYDGAQFGARSLSNSGGPPVNVEYMAPPTLDPRVQESLIRDAIAAKKDALLVSCINDSITEPIDEAAAAGIPVITFDSDCPDANRLGFYGMSSEETGAKAADLLVSAMGPGPKTVAVLTGRAGSDNLERRVAGFRGRLTAEYPELTVALTVHCAETADACGGAVEDEIIEAHPELDGLFVVGLWGLVPACECSESGLSCICDDTRMPKWKAAARGKLKTVAYDSLPFEIELVTQGYVSALVGQKYFGWGYDTVAMMYDHLTNGTEVSGFIDSGFDVVCPNNAADMMVKWQAADFRMPLTPACDL